MNIDYDNLFEMDIVEDDDEYMINEGMKMMEPPKEVEYTPSEYRIKNNLAKHMQLGHMLALYFEAKYSEKLLPDNLLQDQTSFHFTLKK